MKRFFFWLFLMAGVGCRPSSMEIIVRNPSAYERNGEVAPHPLDKILESGGHLLAVTTYRHRPVVYYVGSAWSLGGVKNADEWFETVRRQKDKLSCPLEVYSRK